MKPDPTPSAERIRPRERDAIIQSLRAGVCLGRACAISKSDGPPSIR